MNIQKIELGNVKPNSSYNHTLASLTIVFTEDNLRITGFRIMEKENKRWLLPPSWGDNKNGWHKIVIMTKAEEWKQFEKKVIAEYEKNQTKTMLPDYSDIKPGEVPF